jgi:hypothetical protein
LTQVWFFCKCKWTNVNNLIGTEAGQWTYLENLFLHYMYTALSKWVSLHMLSWPLSKLTHMYHMVSVERPVPDPNWSLHFLL